MAERFCDVIGCMRPASCRLPETEQSAGEEYLCSVHWEQCSLYSCRRASLYVRLPETCPEGGSSGACVQPEVIESEAYLADRARACCVRGLWEMAVLC